MSFVFGATSLTMYAPAKRSLRRSVHRSLAPGSVVGSDPLRAGRDPDAGVDFFLNDAAAGIPDFSVKAQPQRHSPQKTKKIRPQPDRENSFSQASGGETGSQRQHQANPRGSCKHLR